VIAHYVQALTEELADDNPKLEFHFGGSWRRLSPTVGDLDILIVSNDLISPTLMSDGILLPSTVRWQRVGPRIANGEIALPDGPLHIDVWQAPPHSRGAMLCFFTGPLRLNIFQRQRAKRMGMALSQNALTARATGLQLDDGTEESIYTLLQMRFLTPEARQRWAGK
jgi:DNA polymerase/3'-5' exonuclease PolX